MDSNKQTSKGSAKPNSANAPSQNDLAVLQQQMALAAMGILPGMVDPSAMNSAAACSSNSGADLQRILAMQAAGLPLMDANAATLALAGVGGLPLGGMPSMMLPGATGGNDWLAMAQQAQLLAGFGGGVPPQLLSQLYGTNPVANSALSLGSGSAGSSSKTPTNKVKTEAGSHPAPTPSPIAQTQKNISRPNSNTSSSRLTPSGILSPGPSTAGRPSSKPRPSSSHSSTKEVKLTATPDHQQKAQNTTDQLLQAEMLRQLEQQFMIQQLQLKQQQDQIEAALTAIKQPNERQRGTTNLQQNQTSQSEKLQQRLSESIYQQLLSTNSYMPGVTPAMNSYFGSQQMIEQMLGGMGQPSSSNFSKNKSSSGQVKVSAASTILPPAIHRPPSKKAQNGRESKSRSSASVNQYGGSSTFSLTGDPSTDLCLAAIYSQLQGQNETPKSSTSASSKTPPSSLPLPSTNLEKAMSNSKDISQILTNDLSLRRRKQTNPSSINAVSDSLARSNENAYHQGSSSSRVTSSVDDVIDQLKKGAASSSNQGVPLSLVRSKEEAEIENDTRTKKIKTESNDFGAFTTKNNQFSTKERSETKQTNQKAAQNADISEKELLLAVQALANMTGKTDSNAALEEMNKFLLSAYSGLSNSGENVDLNKVNELLTATVASEMKRLQNQQATLTRELEHLTKNETRNSSSFRKQVATSAKSGSDFNSTENKVVHRKRRRIISDEDEVMEPIRQGWDREVKFRRVGNQIRGEVFYHTPEGRKLRTYPEVLKYCEDRGITTLNRNNFSFSSKLKIGTFYEQKGESKIWTKIPESELDRHLGIDDGADDSSNSASASDDNQGSSLWGRKRNPKAVTRNISIQQAIEEKLKKEEENEAAKHAEFKLREQRKLEAQLQREIKERQLMEERRKMEAAKQLQKYQEAIKKEKEREERRRHLVYIKSLETKRKAEERDRKREEIRNERIKKMEQRRLALKLQREMKTPVEDMCLTDHRPLPKMQCLQGTVAPENEKTASPQLSGTATADVLMVLEFLYTFMSAFSMDDDVMPTFEQLQRGLLNDPDHVGALVRLTMALLHQCLCDPGVPAAGPWLHCLIGVKVIDLDVSKENYSEILRLFLWGRNGQKNEIIDLLETEPFPSLTPDQKAGILATMVNELVCSKPVCDEIDNHIENLASLRRDKWLVEGKIRQARIEHANDGSDAILSSPLKSRSKNKSHSEDDHFDKSEKEDSCRDDDSVKSDNKPTCRSDTIIERKMKKLTKEHQSFNDRLFSGAKPLRAFELGHDRYKRRYWVLSNLGGVYVEGLESGGGVDINAFEEEKSGETIQAKEEEEKSASPCPKTETKMELTEKPTSNCIIADLNNSTVEPAVNALTNCKNAIATDGASPKTLNCTPVSEKFDKDQEQLSSDAKIQLNNTQISGNDEEKSSKQELLSIVTPVPIPLTSVTELSNFNSGAPVPSMTNCSASPNAMLPSHPLEQNPPSNVATLNPPNRTTPDVNLNDSEITLEPNISASSIPTSTTSAKTDEDSLIENKSNSSCLAKPSKTSFPSVAMETTSSNDVISSTVVNSVTSTSINSKHNSDEKSVTILSNGGMDLSNSGMDSKIRVTESSSICENHTPDAPTVAPTPLVKTASILSSQLQGPPQKEKMESKVEDQVEAAARAIAAKAVASTSHILYPQIRSPKLPTQCLPYLSTAPNVSSTQSSIIGATPKLTSTPKSQTPPVAIKMSTDLVPGIGKHMSKTLEYIGFDAHSLSNEQVQALSSVKMNEERTNLNILSTIACERSSTNVTNNVLQNNSNQVNVDQDVPMDLSKPSSAATTSVPMPMISSAPPITSFPMLPSVKCESPSFEFYYKQGSPSVYGGYNSMLPYLPTIKPDVNPLNFESPESLDIKPTNVSKTPAPIPNEMKRGWWRISTEEEFDELCSNLHCRGRREKHLQRTVTKHRKYCLESIEQANAEEFQFANSINKGNEEDDEKDENIDDNASDRTETFFDEDQIEDSDETALLIEMDLLRQIDELIQKCQVAGVLYESTTKLPTSSNLRCDLAHLPYRRDVTDNLRHDWSNPVPHDPRSALGVASELLKKLEKSLMRNYLKHPLVRKGGSHEYNSLPSHSDSGSHDVAAGLKTWRNAIVTATSAAQLSICVHMLDTSINWSRAPKFLAKSESSPRGKRKRTEKKGRGKSPASSAPGKKKKSQKMAPLAGMENEDSTSRTLDSMEDVSRDSKHSDHKNNEHPDTSNSVEDHSAIQSDEEGMLLIHDENARADAENWGSEEDASGNHDNDGGQDNEDPRSSEEGEEKKKKRKKNSDKPRKRRKTVLGSCKELLRTLQAHEMATWFLFPVDLKAVPNYRKIIKRPMDFKTIESRLKRKKYKFATEFADDVRTVFDNCQVFNEDESPIGRAGHTLRSIFDERWSLLQDSMNSEEPIG